ncbi:MAG: efflux RND transporter permease subunit [Acetobacteraceae bacterium]|nr:efflux RND transporter permease subunit [Acetobacteraceae bacterium]
MIGIVRVALSRPYTFVVMAMLIFIFGALAAFRTPTDILPNIGIPVVAAVWTYNGMDPDDMSGRIVYYYERTLSSQVNDIQHIESQSLFGYGVVKIFFQPSVNINAAVAQVTAASQTVLKLLPAGVTPPYVLAFNASSVPIIQLALSSKKLPQMRLFDYGQNFIRPQLATVEGAAIPSPYGGKVRQIQIDLNQRELQARGLSAQDVVNALSEQNLITPVGTQKVGKFEWDVQLNDAPKTIEELNDLPVKTVNGTVVYMRDVAQVRDGSPPQTNIVHVDGAHAVLMTILKAGSASTLDIIAGVKKLLPQIEQSLPPSLHLKAVGDQSVFVKAAVSGVIREGIIAAALTGLMILVFLGSWRSTMIITISIPLAILFSVAVLSALGQTINVMTLGGLALAVGILVDDATVTIENINYHLEQGKEVEDAIMDGARQIVVPATVSLLCICIVFVPMFALGGVAGYLFRPLAEAVVFAMIGSYVLSRTLVPTLANFLLRGQSHHGQDGHHGGPAPRSRNPLKRFQQAFERGFERVRQTYLGLLDLGLAHRPALIIGFFVAVGLSFGLVPFLGRDFFPSVESSQIRLHMRAQTGTRIEDVSALAGRVEQAIRQIIPPAHLDTIVDNLGLPVSGINMAYGNSGTIGVEDGDILISLKGGATGSEYIPELRRNLRQRFPGTTFAFLPADIVTQILNFGLPAPIDLQVTGSDLQADRAYADKLLQKVSRVPGVVDARVQQEFNEPTLNVDVNRTYAGLVGLTEKTAATSMLDTLAGSIQTAPTFWLNPRNGVSYPIVVQTPQYDVDTINNLQNMPLGTGSQTQLLGGLAQIHEGSSNAVVSHYNVRPVVDIYASVEGRDLGAVAAQLNGIIQQTQNDVPRGAQVTLRGQVTTMTSAYSQLLAGLAFAIVLIYLLIVVNFQSWLDPFVIVMALPGALAGIVWILFLTGTTLSVPALTGAIMCMGVATANSILVISFARERLAAGATALEAALDAGATRFRPVIMTALAMIIGMGPTALSAEQNAPLGRAVIGGLMFATVATLFLVPTVFSVVHGRTKRAAYPAGMRAAE